ncbi:helix-turn-helix domain-containing protein [Natronorubrum sp. FCH18a]|uniref:helix-turn-helix domain-containing protein n=1 Tax=Natronorubrum sp. FCH18a TaxID=3447018 RepID=UPI003F512766
MQMNPENSQNYTENVALTNLFGDNPKVKILAVLLQQGRDVNVSTIADVGGMSRSSIYRHIDDLLELGVVKKTREIGGSPLYQINKGSQVAKKLAELEWVLVDEVANETDEDVDEGFKIPESPPE